MKEDDIKEMKEKDEEIKKLKINLEKNKNE